MAQRFAGEVGAGRCLTESAVPAKKAKPQHTLRPHLHLMKNIPTTKVELFLKFKQFGVLIFFHNCGMADTQ